MAKYLSLFRLALTIYCIVTLSTGCKKYVEAGLPKSDLLTSSVFNSSSTANAAILGVFSNTASYASQLTLRPALSADELMNYSTSQSYIQCYMNNIIPTDIGNAQLWINFYTNIYQANAVIEGVKDAAISLPLKSQLEGEAKFMRALDFFYLVNLFGDVPLVQTTDYRINSTIARSSSNQVYDFIIKDLTDAKALLNTDFVGSDGLTVSSERLRPSKLSASALLARVYLYAKQYDKAEQEASVVIGDSRFSLESDLTKVFLKQSKEAIFQITEGGTLNTFFADNYILTSMPSLCALSPDQVAAFEPGDKRKQNWVDTYSTYNFSNKYKAHRNSGIQTEYTIVLRLAEQYLIRAEARIQQNKIADGIADLNVIRARARQTPDATNTNPLPDLSTSLIKENALLAVEKERRTELFLEWGDRWLDLKRTGRVNDVMSVVTPVKGGTWESYKQLYPIPFTELQNNPNLIQNTGYN